MNGLPRSVLIFFWGDKLKDLNWEKHKKYIAKTLLEKGNRESINWLLRKADRAYLRGVVKNERLDPKSKNFWEIYLS